MNDALGDRMKNYEKMYTESYAMPFVPLCLRIDGRSFSKWTKGFQKPFDKVLHTAMVKTMLGLCKEFSAAIGYTQSDEISIIIIQKTIHSQLPFNGKITKLCSVGASVATSLFNLHIGDVEKPPAQFDCRAFSVPNLHEAANVLLWRELDATRNSVQGLARAHFSHKECSNKSCPELKTMLMKKGQNWDDCDPEFKRGVYAVKQARDDMPERQEWVSMTMQPLLEVSDRIGLLFGESSES
ncbi:MAG: tRNA(His) guanylyltransferase Thg1 family protein [Candidatus Thorarchaeota archaeon]